HWIQLKVDGTNGTNISDGIKTKAWKLNSDGSVIRKPVCYVSGCQARVSASFSLDGSNNSCIGPDGLPQNGCDFFARATVQGLDESGNIAFATNLPPKKLVLSGNKKHLEYPATSIEDEFTLNKIHYFPMFTINWEWAYDLDGAWTDAGTSDNPLYITKEVPKKEEPSKGYYHYLTVVHIGCKYGDKMNTYEDLVENIKNYFSLRQVTNINGEPLKYYGQWTGGSLGSNTRDLLLYKDGICWAWVKFFIDVLKSQGFQELNNLVTVAGSQIGTSPGFFVKTWIDSPPGISGNPDFPYINVKGSPFYLNNSYNWDYEEVTLITPASAQNNSNPQSDFGSHGIVRVLGTFYDPSYGLFYGAPVFLPPPYNLIETVPGLDANISAYYITDMMDPNIYFIIMNNSLDYPYIHVKLPFLDEDDDW
ncbi:MAG: hypothetical protein KDC85_24050, partial [Saprospiraceae bacterium]|nr:hypothetical protein [Saprospiraceae bacterium]